MGRALNCIVGIADMKVSDDPKVTLVTHALGSCIGVTVYDPVARVGGMIHYMLPESKMDHKKAKETPLMFADTGIPLLFKACYKIKAEKADDSQSCRRRADHGPIRSVQYRKAQLCRFEKNLLAQ